MDDINNSKSAPAEAEFDIMSLDIKGLDVIAASNAGAVLQFKDPFVAGRKLPVFAELLGKHSDQFRDIIEDRSDRAVMKAHAASSRGEEVEPRLSAERRQEGIETLAQMTKRIYTVKDGKTYPVVILNGKRYDSNDAGIIQFYTDQPWAREEADTFIGKTENFIPASYKV